MADRGNVKGFNGVSYGAIVTVVAQDATDDKVQGTFAGADSGLPYALAFSVKVLKISTVPFEKSLSAAYPAGPFM